MPEFPFAAQEGAAGVPQNSRETLINMFAESGSGKAQIIRRQRPGVVRVQTIPGAKRGIVRFTHGHYFVVREKLYRYADGALTMLGALDTSTGQCTFITDDNGKVAVSDGVKLYHWDGAALTEPVTPGEVGTLAFQGGFGIYSETGTGRLYVSGLNDLTTWDALDFATAEGNPDATVRVLVDHNELWFFGERSTEVWRNSGNADFPFQPNTSMERGCIAPFSVAADDNTVFWLGDDGIVYRADGYRPVRISTHAIEAQIANVADQGAGEALVYGYRGHKFYTLRFPGELTVQFNIATGLWNRAKTYGRDDFAIVGNAKATDFYLTDDGLVRLDASVNTDDGAPMERVGISAPVHNGGDWFSVASIRIDAEAGRAATGQTEPVVSLEVSRDGETFGAVRQRGLGTTGDFRRRVVWRGLGQFRSITARFTVTDDIDFTVLSVSGEAG